MCLLWGVLLYLVSGDSDWLFDVGFDGICSFVFVGVVCWVFWVFGFSVCLLCLLGVGSVYLVFGFTGLLVVGGFVCFCSFMFGELVGCCLCVVSGGLFGSGSVAISWVCVFGVSDWGVGCFGIWF